MAHAEEEVPAEGHVQWLSPKVDVVVTWLHEHVSPYSFGFTLVLAAKLNEITAYLFVAAFLLTLFLLSAKWWLFIYRRGMIRWIWETTRYYVKWLWRQLLALHKLYWFKVAFMVLASGVVAGSAQWAYHHMDIVRLITAVAEFIMKLPQILLNAPLLLKEIHRLLNGLFLDWIVWAMSTVWDWASEIIVNHPGQGLIVIVMGISAIILLFIAANTYRAWMPNYILNLFEHSVAQAEARDRAHIAALAAAAAEPRGRAGRAGSVARGQS
jgi:hypothetical protein